MSEWEIVLRGGRVIDPESGFDAVADVAVGGGRVTQVGAGLPAAPTDVDVAGLVVTAGFVDLHSHVNDLAGLRLQALDGVTDRAGARGGGQPGGGRLPDRRGRGTAGQLRLRHVLGAGPHGPRSPGSRRAARWPTS